MTIHELNKMAGSICSFRMFKVKEYHDCDKEEAVCSLKITWNIVYLE